MKNFLISFLILYPFLSNFQAGAQETIQNKATSRHIGVLNDRILIIPPENFEKSGTSESFVQPKTGSTLMLHHIPVSFNESAKSFTNEGLLDQGISAKTIQSIKINGTNAILVHADQNTQALPYLKIILCFGTPNETYLLSGSFPLGFDESGKSMEESMLSVIPADHTAEKANVPDFRVTTAGTKLKYAKTASGSSIYTVDGRVPTESTDLTTFTISSKPAEKEIKNRKEFSIARLNQLPFIIENVETVNTFSAGGLEGYEIISYGKNPRNGLAVNIYQAMLFKDDHYYVMEGYSYIKYNENIRIFQKIASTFFLN